MGLYGMGCDILGTELPILLLGLGGLQYGGDAHLGCVKMGGLAMSGRDVPILIGGHGCAGPSVENVS